MDWADWVQQVGGNLVGAAVDAKYRQPYEIDKLRLQALGDTGFYTEGQRGVAVPGGSAVAGISPTVLLLGAGLLLAVMLLKD